MFPRHLFIATLAAVVMVLSLACLACSKSKPPEKPAADGSSAGSTAAAPAPAASAPEVASSPLWGTSWVLVDLAGTPSIEGVQPTLDFPEPGKAAGMGSCNRFFGAVEVDGETITFKAMGSTRMACGAEIGKQETVYLKALQEAQRFELEGDELLVYSKDLEKPLRFKAKS